MLSRKRGDLASLREGPSDQPAGSRRIVRARPDELESDVRRHFGVADFVGRRPDSSNNVKRASTAVTRNGCRRGGFFEGCRRRGDDERTSRLGEGRKVGKRGEPHGRSGMQEAREPCVEQAVEVAPNHEDGTGRRRVAPSRPMDASSFASDRERTARPGVDTRGERRRRGGHESQERQEHGPFARSRADVREVLRHDRERAERDAKVRRATSTNLGSVDRSTG